MCNLLHHNQVGINENIIYFLTCFVRITTRNSMNPISQMGWSGGAMVLGELPVPGRPTIWMLVEQGPIVLAEGAGGGCLDIFTLLYLFSSRSPSLWETARYRLKYCLKGPLNPNQTTNQKQSYQSNHMIPRLVKGIFLEVTATDHVPKKG